MSHSDNSRRGTKAYPRRGRGFSWLLRSETKRARRKASISLAKGDEPQPYRPRHDALRNWW